MTDTRQEAVEFWRQFEVPVDYIEPWKIRGVVHALREVKDTSGNWVPRLVILGTKIAIDDEFPAEDSGRFLVLTAHPSRLRAELTLATPAVGDRIWIAYLGEDDKAIPGLNKTKRFRVVVKAPGPSASGNGNGNGNGTLGTATEADVPEAEAT